jgi:hypothetical protein
LANLSLVGDHTVDEFGSYCSRKFGFACYLIEYFVKKLSRVDYIRLVFEEVLNLGSALSLVGLKLQISVNILNLVFAHDFED